MRNINQLPWQRAAQGGYLSMDDLKRIAPSVFAEKASPKMSERYVFYPTSAVVEAMVKANFVPTQVWTKAAKEGNRMFCKHMLRFQAKDTAIKTGNKVGDQVPEIVIINAHNGGARWAVHGGIFRFVCSNGMVVADASLGGFAIKHSGQTADEVIERSQQIIGRMPAVLKHVDTMKKIKLSDKEQHDFAAEALQLRWNSERRGERVAARQEKKDQAEFRKLGYVDAPVLPSQLLTVNREEDNSGSLWHVFNRVQENLTTRALPGRSAGGRLSVVRGVNAIDKNLKINQGLWEMAMARLPAAA